MLCNLTMNGKKNKATASQLSQVNHVMFLTLCVRQFHLTAASEATTITVIQSGISFIIHKCLLMCG